MKYKKIALITILFILVSFSNSIAISKVGINLNKKIFKLNEQIEINISINGSKCAAYNLEIYFDESKVEPIKENENTSIANNKIIQVWYDEKGGENAKEGNITNIKWRAIGEGDCNFTLKGEFYDENGDRIEAEFEKYNISIGENNKNIKSIESEEIISSEQSNTNLETLAIEGVLLYPPYESNVNEYKAEISNENTQIKILAIPQNEKATIEILGNRDLKEGWNIIYIKVISENQESQKEYKINVYRRTIKEEGEYKEEQKQNQEKLEEIYQNSPDNPELLSTDNDLKEIPQVSNYFQNEKAKNWVWELFWNSFVLMLIK